MIDLTDSDLKDTDHALLVKDTIDLRYFGGFIECGASGIDVRRSSSIEINGTSIEGGIYSAFKINSTANISVVYNDMISEYGDCVVIGNSTHITIKGNRLRTARINPPNIGFALRIDDNVSYLDLASNQFTGLGIRLFSDMEDESGIREFLSTLSISNDNLIWSDRIVFIKDKDMLGEWIPNDAEMVIIFRSSNVSLRDMGLIRYHSLVIMDSSDITIFKNYFYYFAQNAQGFALIAFGVLVFPGISAKQESVVS
jgi:hypothetical protein